MESFVIECREAREFARGCGTRKARAGYTCAQQSVAKQEGLSCRGTPCSCRFYACERKSFSFEVHFVRNDNEEKSRCAKAKIDIQNEMKSCPTSYPMKKIACLRWRVDASCC